MRIKTPESGVLRACLDLLSAEHIWNCRMNVGAYKDGDYFLRFGFPGMADILAAPLCSGIPTFLWIECKSDSGKQSAQQTRFMVEVSRQGHHYLLVRKPEELMAWLKLHKG